jgi:hypothetical protein
VNPFRVENFSCWMGDIGSWLQAKKKKVWKNPGRVRNHNFACWDWQGTPKPASQGFCARFAN